MILFDNSYPGAWISSSYKQFLQQKPKYSLPFLHPVLVICIHLFLPLQNIQHLSWREMQLRPCISAKSTFLIQFSLHSDGVSHCQWLYRVWPFLPNALGVHPYFNILKSKVVLWWEQYPITYMLPLHFRLELQATNCKCDHIFCSVLLSFFLTNVA